MKNKGKTEDSNPSAAQGAALHAPIGLPEAISDPSLKIIIVSWPKLPATAREAILRLVEGYSK